MLSMLLAIAMLSRVDVASIPKVGDKVVVVVSAELKTATDKTVALSAGTTLDVLAVEHDRFKVSAGRIGWIAASAVIPVDAADSYFSAVINSKPQDAVALFARGKFRFERGQHDMAIEDLDQSLKIAPSSEAFTIRGFAWKRRGDKEKAMADFDQAIKLNPKQALAWRVRGATWAGKADYDKALANYSESIRLDPDNPDSLHHRVVMLSICPADNIRDGKQAIKDATQACELTEWKNPLYLSGLAFANAETGDFDAAIKWFTRAMELSGPKQSELMRPRLEQLQRHEPIRSTWK